MPCNIDFVKNWELRYQGAESRIYFGIQNDQRCVIKHRFPKSYRHPTLNKKLTKERTKRERRMLEKIKSKSLEFSEYTPKVIWSDDSTILMTEVLNCESLSNFIEQNPKDALKVAPLVGRCVAELHNMGIIHNDLTTSNLLLMPRIMKHEGDCSSKKLKSDFSLDSYIIVPIDFGLSTGSYHPEERAVDLYVLERAIISAHFPDAEFFNLALEGYLNQIDEKTCEPAGKLKIVERLREVRARGRKADYESQNEA